MKCSCACLCLLPCLTWLLKSFFPPIIIRLASFHRSAFYFPFAVPHSFHMPPSLFPVPPIPCSLSFSLSLSHSLFVTFSPITCSFSLCASVQLRSVRSILQCQFRCVPQAHLTLEHWRLRISGAALAPIASSCSSHARQTAQLRLISLLSHTYTRCAPI